MKPTKICSFEGCGRPFYAKDLCNGHYIQHRKGQELRPLRPSSRGRPLEQRFWVKVKKAPGCWEWVGAKGGYGYGQFSVYGRKQKAHRVSWELANGPIPDGMVIDHRCSNPACVNPSHLRIVTQPQNMQHRKGPNKGSLSGVRGVTWHGMSGKWMARAMLNGRNYYAGTHSTIADAEAAAKALRAELFTHSGGHQPKREVNQ